MTKARKLMEAQIEALCEMVGQLASAHSKELGAKFEELLNKADVKAASAMATDGRTGSWNEERRAKAAEAAKRRWERTREAKGLTERFFKHSYSNEAPTVLKNIDAVAADSGLSVRTVTNKLTEYEYGFAVRVGKAWVAYTRNPEDLDRVLSHKAVLHGDADLQVVLPYKGVKRF